MIPSRFKQTEKVKKKDAGQGEQVSSMPKYVNERYGFELNFPDDWAKTSGRARIPLLLSNVIMHANILEEYGNQQKEYINIVIEKMQPEIPPDIIEMIFHIEALDRNYTEIEFGRIHIAERDHTWATYVMNRRGWLKKYGIVLNGYGYALTASCPIEQRSQEVEGGWDRIAASFRLTGTVKPYAPARDYAFLMDALRNSTRIELEARKRKAAGSLPR